MKRIYVTGCCGMIGSALVKRLIEMGSYVIGIDNLSRGQLDRLNGFSHESCRFEFRYTDLRLDRQWARDMSNADVVVHTADIVAGIGHVFDNEWSIFKGNNEINSSFISVIREKSPERLIYLGTACSYPLELQMSVDNSSLLESDKFPANPESGYGWSKLIGEIEFRLALKDLDTRLITLDLHNVYGWPCDYEERTAQVIPSLVRKALTSADGTVSVWGNGSQGRAFVHVLDVLAGIERALDYDGDFQNFMLGPGKCTTVAELAEIIVAHPLSKARSICWDLSKPVGDIGRSSGSNLAGDELGWMPQISLKSGLDELIRHMAAELDESI